MSCPKIELEVAWLRLLAAFLATAPDDLPYRDNLLAMGRDLAGCADRIDAGLELLAAGCPARRDELMPSSPTWPPGLTDNEIEDLEERAAILEYDADLERLAAERLALELLEQRRDVIPNLSKKDREHE